MLQFNQIKNNYDEYYKDILRKGQLLVRDTEAGTWGFSGSDDVFDFFNQIKLDRFSKFVDLGSGDGKVVAIASLFTDATGIEMDKSMHADACRIISELNIDVNLVNKDYMEVDLSKFDFVFINPDKGFHNGLETKLQNELNGKLFVYNVVFQPRFLRKGKMYGGNGMPVVCYHKTI